MCLKENALDKASAKMPKKYALFSVDIRFVTVGRAAGLHLDLTRHVFTTSSVRCNFVLCSGASCLLDIVDLLRLFWFLNFDRLNGCFELLFTLLFCGSRAYSEYWPDFTAAVNTTLTYHRLLTIYCEFVRFCLFTCPAYRSMLMLMLAYFSDSCFCPPELTAVFALL